MHMKGPFQLAAFAAAFLLFALPDSPGADLAPTVGGDALAQPGCTWDGTTLSCPRLDGGIDEFCDNPQNWGNSFCSYGGGYMMAPGKDNGSSGGSGGGFGGSSGESGGGGSYASVGSDSGEEQCPSGTYMYNQKCRPLHEQPQPPDCPAGHPQWSASEEHWECTVEATPGLMCAAAAGAVAGIVGGAACVASVPATWGTTAAVLCAGVTGAVASAAAYAFELCEDH